MEKKTRKKNACQSQPLETYSRRVRSHPGLESLVVFSSRRLYRGRPVVIIATDRLVQVDDSGYGRR